MQNSEDPTKGLHTVRELRQTAPESFTRAKNILAEILTIIEDPQTGGPIPPAGKKDLKNEHTALSAEADRVWASRHSVTGSWTFQSRSKRLEEKARRLQNAVELSCNIARMRVKAQNDARRKLGDSPTVTNTNLRTTNSYPDAIQAHERYWCDRARWLSRSGYKLRRRYQPGWRPSWGLHNSGTGYEDSLYYHSPSIMDAIRTSDNTPVMLKRISKTSHLFEVQIGVMFSQMKKSGRNHCVPIYEVLDDQTVPDIKLIVMPRLRPYDSPPFQSVGEVVECLRQAFEGLAYMHKHHIAHRDYSLENLMMDASKMYPIGYHPIDINRTPDCGSIAPHFSREEHPPKYYIVNFSTAHRYNPAKPLPGDVRHDEPFAADVYDLGYSISNAFFPENSVYSRTGRQLLSFMRPLLMRMTHSDPTLRPSANEVVDHFDVVWKSLSVWTLKAAVMPGPATSPNPVMGFLRGLKTWTGFGSGHVRDYGETGYSKRLPPPPPPPNKDFNAPHSGRPRTDSTHRHDDMLHNRQNSTSARDKPLPPRRHSIDSYAKREEDRIGRENHRSSSITRRHSRSPPSHSRSRSQSVQRYPPLARGASYPVRSYGYSNEQGHPQLVQSPIVDQVKPSYPTPPSHTISITSSQGKHQSLDIALPPPIHVSSPDKEDVSKKRRHRSSRRASDGHTEPTSHSKSGHRKLRREKQST